MNKSGPDPYSLTILSALQNKPMYQGTVDKATVQKRRAKNKAARRARSAGRHCLGGDRMNPDNQGCGGERVDSTFLKGALQLLTLLAVPMLLLFVVLVLAWWTR